MTTADLTAAVSTIRNGTPNLCDAVTWVLGMVRAMRDGDTMEANYRRGWVKFNARMLDRATRPGFAAAVLALTVAESGLDDFDAALCGAIERLNRANGTGRYDAAGRLHHRPAAYAA